MNNKSKYIFFASILGIGILLTANACNLQDWVVVEAPPAVIDVAEVEGKMTLAEADRVWEEWTHYVETNTKYFQEAVRDAEGRYATLHSIFSMSMNVAGEASQGIPYGGLLFGALTGVAGLLMPQPKFTQKKNEKKE